MTLDELFKEWPICYGGKLEADIRGMLAAKDAELANLRRCLTATDAQRDEAIEAHSRACAESNEKQVEIVKARDEIARLKEQRDRLRAAVDSLRPGHYFCDHTSETCPRFQWGCTDDAKCTCGADEKNAEIDKVLREIGNG